MVYKHYILWYSNGCCFDCIYYHKADYPKEDKETINSRLSIEIRSPGELNTEYTDGLAQLRMAAFLLGQAKKTDQRAGVLVFMMAHVEGTAAVSGTLTTSHGIKAQEQPSKLNRGVRDGVTIWGTYKGVRVGVKKTHGLISTIFPDARYQPRPKTKRGRRK